MMHAQQKYPTESERARVWGEHELTEKIHLYAAIHSHPWQTQKTTPGEHLNGFILILGRP